MKILLVITLYLISGPVGHSDVIGYSGGRVVILSNLQWDLGDVKYICKMRETHCDYIINTASLSHNVYTERFMLFKDSQGFLRSLITNLKLQDAGTYRIGVGDECSYDVNLDVRTNPFYGGPKTITAYQGQNISIICNYPLEYKNFDKYVYKEDSDHLVKDIHALATHLQTRRFSISYEGSAKLLSLNISDVRGADGGVYLCGVMSRNQAVLYYSFFADIQLHITGPVGHSDVIGYSGGRVVILSNLQWDLGDVKYICKMRETHCDYIINTASLSHNVHTERFMLFRDSQGFLRSLITNLKLQDAGTYRIGVGDECSYDVNLDVRTNPCYGGPKTITAYQGQNISITCNYPLEYKNFVKYVYKEDSDCLVKDIHAFATHLQTSRLSISYEGSAEVLSLNISDVRGADGGVYFCGAMNRNQTVLYYSFFADIQLHVTGSSVTIISVCVCVALLLFGGFALFTSILICKTTRGSECSSKRRLIDNIQAPSVYENDLANLHLYENLDIIIRLNRQNMDSFTSQSDSTYQRLDPLTNQSDSGGASLMNTTVSLHSDYQSLNPRTQTDSIYQTLQF